MKYLLMFMALVVLCPVCRSMDIPPAWLAVDGAALKRVVSDGRYNEPATRAELTAALAKLNRYVVRPELDEAKIRIQQGMDELSDELRASKMREQKLLNRIKKLEHKPVKDVYLLYGELEAVKILNAIDRLYGEAGISTELFGLNVDAFGSYTSDASYNHNPGVGLRVSTR